MLAPRDPRSVVRVRHWSGSVACLHVACLHTAWEHTAWEPTSAPQVAGLRTLVETPCGSDSCESKRDVSDFWLIIYGAAAVLIFFKLWSVLGQRTGRERPPYDPYSARDTMRPSTNDNVVALPDAPPSRPRSRSMPQPRCPRRMAGPGSPTPAPRSRPASTPLLVRTRASTPSISSP